MFKYIYVFILIIFLFWIKCKLQKNNKIKEEFSLNPEEKLADMFSSSDGTDSSSDGTDPPPPTFYDKISKLNSNIKYTDDDNCVMDIPRFKIENTSGVSIGLLVNNQTLDFKNLNNFYNINIFDETVVYATHVITTDTWNVFSRFIYGLSQDSESINTSVKDLLDWHEPPPYKRYSWKPYGTAADSSLKELWESEQQTPTTLDECITKCDSYSDCVGFSIDSQHPGCWLYSNITRLDYTRSNRKTYFKPVT